jgi:pyruvate/2-oxoglutarate dehydrogenase complex dihydrolipoamide acyltransferase (E2) component
MSIGRIGAARTCHGLVVILNITSSRADQIASCYVTVTCQCIGHDFYFTSGERFFGDETMWKQATMGAAALLIGGSMMVYAQQQPGNPTAPAATQPQQPAAQAPAAQQPPQNAGGWRQGGWRHVSPQDLAAFADARIAALHAGLELTADQEKNWPAFEQALRDMSKMRIARIEERQKRISEPRDQNQTPPNPIERLQRRADAMTTRGTALKHLADAAAPLYQSLDDAQKHRFLVLARVLRPHERHQAMWRGRFGDDERRGMDGEFRHHRFGDHDMRDQRRGAEEDYRGPL